MEPGLRYFLRHDIGTVNVCVVPVVQLGYRSSGWLGDSAAKISIRPDTKTYGEPRIAKFGFTRGIV